MVCPPTPVCPQQGRRSRFDVHLGKSIHVAHNVPERPEFRVYLLHKMRACSVDNQITESRFRSFHNPTNSNIVEAPMFWLLSPPFGISRMMTN